MAAVLQCSAWSSLPPDFTLDYADETITTSMSSSGRPNAVNVVPCINTMLSFSTKISYHDLSQRL